MLAQLLSLLLLSLLSCQARIAQQEFCKSSVVVRAKILPKDSLYGQAVKPSVPKYFRLFELKIVEVYKDDLSSGLDKDSQLYAISKDTTYNIDADGCDIIPSDKPIEALLHFNTLDTIKRSCKIWSKVTKSQKNALKNDLYDCDCDIDSCYDRVSGKKGKPDCDRKGLSSIVCAKNSKGVCTWQGPKKTCISCNRDSPIKKVKRCGTLWG